MQDFGSIEIAEIRCAVTFDANPCFWPRPKPGLGVFSSSRIRSRVARCVRLFVRARHGDVRKCVAGASTNTGMSSYRWRINSSCVCADCFSVFSLRDHRHHRSPTNRNAARCGPVRKRHAPANCRLLPFEEHRPSRRPRIPSSRRGQESAPVTMSRSPAGFFSPQRFDPHESWPCARSAGEMPCDLGPLKSSPDV